MIEPRRALMLMTLILLSVSLTIMEGGSQTTTNLEVEANPTHIKAGFNTTITFSIINNFEPIYELDVNLVFPQAEFTTTSPTPLGSSNWKFNKVKEGDNVTFQAVIYAPEEAAGNAYVATLTLTYKRLGYISPNVESHTLGFYAKGAITMVVYDYEVEPDPVSPGSTVSITASLLNRGNIPAQFTNVTLIASNILILKMESYSYLGEVDPNSPAPFTLEAAVNPNTPDGNYSATIKVEYEDDESVSHILQREVTINVHGIPEQVPETHVEKILRLARENLVYAVVGLVVIVLLGVGVTARRRSSREFEEELV